MNLTRLFEAQKALDERITEEKGLQGQDLMQQKVVALLTELGECANEWRGFKFWSERRTPSRAMRTTEGATRENAVEFHCGKCNERFEPDDYKLRDIWGEISEDCPECEDGYLYPLRFKDPLLEEYVDIVHFALSLVIDTHKGQNLPVHIPASRRLGERIEKYFIDIAHSASSILSGGPTANIVAAYSTLGSVLGLGQALGFSEEQIEDAYFQKNATNHKRQKEHY